MSPGCRIYSYIYIVRSFWKCPSQLRPRLRYFGVRQCGLIGGNLLSHLRDDVVTLSDTASHTLRYWYCPRNTRCLRSQ